VEARLAIHLIRKLEQFAKLSTDDKRALEAAASHKVRHVGPREDIIHEGDRPRQVNLILEGFACRYKALEDGRRQIVAFFIPGDICDARMFILTQMDHSIGTLSPVKLVEIPGDVFLDLADTSPRIARALWWNSLVEESIAREWTLNVGQRTAYERMAHLLCEFFIRMRAVGLVDGQSCELPMTQAELADALGLSTVHTNRTLQELRRDNLITLRGKNLVVSDLEALQAAALFNANYLHFDRSGQALDANDS
jgi:CRP-like cAMP-binding protein